MRHIRDPIHGFIKINDSESKIIDTPVFQRLRRIKQLAFAYLVYPGANHSRFEHSLGVYHVAGLMGECLKLDQDDIECIKLAALLHDIGHGPFSHVSEDIFKLFNDDNTLKHEYFSKYLVETDERIRQILGDDRCKRIGNIILNEEESEHPIITSILSGLIDCDKQDYFLRDSYFCGVKYGVFDQHQLHRELRQVVESDGTKHLAISQDGVHAVEQFIQAKYYLTTQVIRHKIRLITDQMLVRAIKLGIEIDNNSNLIKLFKDVNHENISDYLNYGDDLFLSEFSNDPTCGMCQELILRLQNRNLFKRVFRIPLSSDLLAPEIRDLLSRIHERNNKVLQEKIEAEIALRLSSITKSKINAHHVILNYYVIKSVYDESINKEGPILVDMETDKPTYFDDVSTIIRPVVEKLNESFLEVYAPMEYISDYGKNMLKQKIKPEVLNILNSASSEEIT